MTDERLLWLTLGLRESTVRRLQEDADKVGYSISSYADLLLHEGTNRGSVDWLWSQVCRIVMLTDIGVDESRKFSLAAIVADAARAKLRQIMGDTNGQDR